MYYILVLFILELGCWLLCSSFTTVMEDVTDRREDEARFFGDTTATIRMPSSCLVGGGLWGFGVIEFSPLIFSLFSFARLTLDGCCAFLRLLDVCIVWVHEWEWAMHNMVQVSCVCGRVQKKSLHSLVASLPPLPLSLSLDSNLCIFAATIVRLLICWVLQPVY